MTRCQQGVHAFLRAYYHHKSADWAGNQPTRLESWSATELARMRTYYIMDLDQDMAQTGSREMPSPDAIASCKWLPDHELCVYSDEYSRIGFKGGLQWYRCRTGGIGQAELEVFSGRTIDVPSMFIAGARDWGIRQTPGAFERMQLDACSDMRGCHVLNGAGHWVQQENPAAVLSFLLPFLRS
jgi:pimeloyl-ACP methyl ester carboxylesterase